LDRNHDGKVNLQDLKSNTGVNQGAGLNAGANAGAHHNPLDRNHDGRVNAQDLHANSGAGLNTGLNSGLHGQTGLVRAEPTVIETIQKDVVVHERIHPVQKEEIQPVIYREREQLDVKQVTQLLHETQIQPTLVQQRELAPQVREAVVERSAPITENYVAPSREVDATLRSQVVHAPIVNEVIKKTIVEEIQPVLERDIIQSTVIQNTQPIFEKFVDAPQVYRETRVVQDRGIVGGDLAALQAQGFNVGGLGLNQGAGLNTGLNTGLNQGAHHNPLDRNHDGRVNAQDLHANSGLNHGAGLNTGLNAGLGGENLVTHHGIVGSNQGAGLNTGLNAGAGAHVNPLDRNHDGKVDLKDLSGRSSTQTNTHANVL